MHTVQLISGRMRGQWFARCSCGFESKPTYSKLEAEAAMKDHSYLYSNKEK